jgi:hypothetical protein
MTSDAQSRGSLAWYFAKSKEIEGAPLRCPYATPDRCPRHFQSLALAHKLGACAMDPYDENRFQTRWSQETLTSALPEVSPSVMSSNDQFSMLTNFCPEVTYELKGAFASAIYAYADEIDRDLAHQRLIKTGEGSNDFRWSWAEMIPLHYRECPTFALLQPSWLCRIKRGA